MSSISNILINPNPNSSLINRHYSPNPIKFKPKRKPKSKLKRNQNQNPKNPNWLQLPEDIWLLILSKLSTIDVLENVQKVCLSFRKICKQPALFRVIDMRLPDGEAFHDLPYCVNAMTCHAVDRSDGCLVDIYLEYLCDDPTLNYIVQRSNNLKHLRLAHYVYVYDDQLIEAVRSLPMLEEIQLLICSFSEETVEAIGHACPTLVSFTLNGVGSKKPDYIFNEQALGISRSMPNLRHLQLIGNSMSNEGLKAILDGCPHLESLDLRACFHVDLSGALGKRCEMMMKHLRYPNDSTEDYGRDTCFDEDYLGDDPEYDFDDSNMFGMYP